ncbi:MAG: tRNA pseudouridine(13) synthase TruD [Planctomycetia bacterium TMED53]|nr:MAG: tRNA pseudouridine(13) synthase TruD [Planctomycetia bacterium TMED53]
MMTQPPAEALPHPSADGFKLLTSKEAGYQPPRLFPEIEPIGGVIRERWEDFRVTEIPLYTPCGAGEHLYLTIEKRNRTSLQARNHLARVFDLSPDDVGFAGFKDKRAVTTQTFSLPVLSDQKVSEVDQHWIEVKEVQRHKNKIRTGHLQGNRFEILIRGTRDDCLEDARKVLQVIASSGLPNFYGPQRFGMHGDGARIGSALLRRQIEEAIAFLLAPSEGVEEEYRSAFAANDIQQAMQLLPPGRNTELALLKSLRSHPGNMQAAARRIPRPLRKMYYSAYQSELFNWVLIERMTREPDGFHVPWGGDICQLEGRKSRFHVEETPAAVKREQERAAVGEISPTGPIYGRKMKLPSGLSGQIEAAVLEEEGLRPESWLSHVRGLDLDGSRRPLRVPVGDPEAEWVEGEGLWLKFALPAGAFATTLLEQVMGPGASKIELDPEGSRDHPTEMAEDSN